MTRLAFIAVAAFAAGYALARRGSRPRSGIPVRRRSPDQQWVLFAARAIASAMGPGSSADLITVSGEDPDGHLAVWRFRRDAAMAEVGFPEIPDDVSSLEGER